MAITFRRFDEKTDWRLFAEMHCSVNPDFLRNEEDFRRQQGYRPADRPIVHFIGELEGRPVCGFGYGDQYWAHAEGRKIIEHQAYREYEAQALDAILRESHRLASQDGTSELNIWTRDDRPDQIAVFLSFGFHEVERQPVTRLDLASFDPGERNGAPKNLRFVSLLELEGEGLDWRRPAYDATLEIVADIPSHHETTPPSYETYCKWMENRESHDPALMFVALDEGRIVAYSSVQRSKANPGLVETGLSGVVRSHRRRGLVTALKIHALEKLKGMGFQTVQTDNLDHNPMYGINQRLGFQPAWSWVHYLKQL